MKSHGPFLLRISGAARHVLLACALAGLALPGRLGALDPERSVHQYNCRTWRRANGLPSNAVAAIAQTADGHLWLGTSKGLVQFDGVEFGIVGVPGDVAAGARIVTTMARRSAGGFWLGLERGGFGYFDGGRIVALNDSEFGGAFTSARVVRESHDGSLLVGTADAGGRWPGSGPPRLLAPGTDVMAIHEDARGRVWLGTASRGLLYWEDGHVQTFPDAEGRWRGREISAVAVDGEGAIWVGATNGLHSFNADFSPRAPTGVSHPRAMLLDRRGVLWIGTASEGLVRHKDGVFSSLRQADGLASDRVISLAESEDGSLWIGTEDGLSQLTDVKFPIFSVADGLSAEACLAVAASPRGGVWAGNANGLSLVREGQIRNFGVDAADGFYSRWVKSVFEARDGGVYLFGGRKSLMRFSGDRVVKTWIFDEWPRAMAEDDRGVVLAVADGLMRIEGDEVLPYLLADGTPAKRGWINALLVARDGTIWIAGNDGVAQIEEGVLHDRTREVALEDRMFTHLREDDAGAVWAVRNTGLVRFRDGRAAFVGREHGLPEAVIYAIVPDTAGSFWMDSSEGILRAGQADLNAVADGAAARLECTVYEGQHAVKTTDKAAQEYSGCRSTDGRIWFPSASGLIMIDPANVPINSHPPPVYIRRVRVDGREYPPDREPVLAPGPGNLEFDYSALDFQAPEKLRFVYRLEGYQTEWVEAGARRTAFYTNLGPGHYRFRVHGCNADGLWNVVGASFALDLPRRFFETPWFRASMAVAVLGLAAAGWRSRERRRQRELREARRSEELQRQMNLTLEQRVRERTAELETANRELESFSYSVSHDLRAPLRGIDGWSLALLEDYAAALDTTARGYLDRVRRECQRMGLLIDDLLKLSRTTRSEMHPEPVDLSDLAQATARRVAEARPVAAVEFACAPGLRAQGDRRLLEAVLFNLLDNAWKFSARTAKPRVEFGRTDTPEGPAFFVRDNGAGFDMRHAGKLFGVFQRMHSQEDFPGTGVGLATVQRIVNRHGGRIWAASTPGVETTFYFTLPDVAAASAPATPRNS